MIPTPARWFRFGIVGLAGIGVQVLLVVALADQLGLALPLATAVAVGVAILHNFAWHVRWTWADRTPGAPVALLLARFTLANGLVSLVGNALVVTVLVDVMHLPVIWAALLAIAACGLINYVLADALVFAPARWHGPVR